MTNENADTKMISFEGYHLPGLKSGEIQIGAHLEFNLKDSKKTTFSAPEASIFVNGPRFILSPAEIHAVFPPRDSLGEYDNVLPHIELTPSTLPWQRESGNQVETTPWLALILLQEDEWRDESKVKIKKVHWEQLRNEIGLAKEITDVSPDKKNPYPPVKALRIDKDFLSQILPTTEDLKWLSHVRVGHDQHGQEVERAVLVCNRMPRPGARAQVHLVSLENRLKNDGTFNFQKGKSEKNKPDKDKSADKKIALLSLYTWEFTCPEMDEYKVSNKAISRLPSDDLRKKVTTLFPAGEARDTLYRGKDKFKDELTQKHFSEKEIDTLLNVCHIQTETFKGLMDALDLGWLHVSEQRGPLFRAGSVPLAHGLRNGGKTASWYRGPFVPDKHLSQRFEMVIRSKLPLRNADQLLMYNQTTKMLDVSYAAAWELGRLMAVSDPHISQSIAEWKTSHARETALAEQNLFVDHIPFTDSVFAHQRGGGVEGKVQKFFSDLSLLHGVPFHYLIPHESLLPDESLRLFYVDPLWVESLLDGAFSIGRHTQYDVEREKQAERLPHQIEKKPMSGILLRSDLVSGWPSLMVEAYGEDDNKLKSLRYERLGPNVLLVLFEGTLKTLTIHLPPESLHFGFSRSLRESVYTKELKSLETAKETGKAINLPWRDQVNRVIDAASMVAAMQEKGIEIKHSGQFAVELLEGVPRLEVSV
ncbi:MAG: hypothetical protein D6816_16520 [Bacteroidetes bacterium]|nr:MAG: hypothetical protein D6816_16520 [Bacteroidota bacterium]